MAPVQEVHRVDGHAHIGRAFAFRDVELLHRDDRMDAGEITPALETRLRPIAVGAPNVDRAKLPQDQQDFVEMLGAGVVGIDKERNIVFTLIVPVIHVPNPFMLPCRNDDAGTKHSFEHWTRIGRNNGLGGTVDEEICTYRGPRRQPWGERLRDESLRL